MSIRWRLTLWFTLILGVIILLFGAFFYAALQNWLITQVDGNLRVYSAQVHLTMPSGETTGPLDYDVIHSSLPPINELVSPGIFVQIIDSNGNVVVKSDNLHDQELPPASSLIATGFSEQEDIQTVSSGNTRIRIMVSPLHLKNQTQDQTLVLEVAQSLAPTDAAIARIGLAVLVSMVVILTLALISGAILVRRALSPVRRITTTAQGISSSSDLSRRVGYRGPADEIGQLATTFDHMIERLDRAFQSQKSFVADASHELRGPLTVIQGNLDLLKRNLSEEDRRESVRALEAETTRMTKIMSNLLVLAELESGHLEQQENVSLKEMLLDAGERAMHLAGGRRIVIERQEDLWVKGDVDRLGQVLRNLVDNAIRYTPEGGTITLSLFENGDWALLKVADTGIGISPEHLPHIFDRFYRADRARSRASGGTGLGLAIVKGIVEQHGGRVTVTSEPGEGSIFTVWLTL